jgi:DNA polymerase-3 subunit alpha
MGFLELEDRIMRVEAVVFPTIWKRIGSKLEKGGLAIIQATVQQQDDDYKLIVEDCVPIDHADMDLEGQVRRLQKQAQARAARSTGGSAVTGGASSQGRTQNAQGQAVQVQRPNITGNTDKDPTENASASAEARLVHEHGRSASAERKPQRVYIKIMSQYEEPAILERLKGLLAGHAGQLDTVLFYAQGQKSIALSGSYRVKPSPQLIASVEQLLGAGTIVVK